MTRPGKGPAGEESTMKIIVAPDSFKGSLSAKETAEAMQRGILQVVKNGEVVLMPMADGGEGFVDAMAAALNGQLTEVDTFDPLGRPITAAYALVDDGQTAIIETAAASGLTLLKRDERNPLKASTYGTGLLVRHAIERGCKTIYIGLGGSATNDGGIGLAQALGYRFIGESGHELDINGRGLEKIAHIDASNRLGALDDVQVIAACDVDTRLCGEQGASAVFGPQKGATPEMVQFLDGVLRSLADAVKSHLGFDMLTLAGGGAAGGLGAGLAAFCGATLQNGIDLVLRACRFEEKLPGTDLILTGEGNTDEQTLMGKVPFGIGKRAKQAHVPVVCLSGGLGKRYERVKEAGISAVFSIMPRPASLDEAMENAAEWIEEASREIISLWLAAQKR